MDNDARLLTISSEASKIDIPNNRNIASAFQF